MGTGAVNNPDLLLEVSQQYHRKISVGLDVRKMIALKDGKIKHKFGFDFLETIKNFHCSIVFTDINKDGMKQGINMRTP